MINLEFFFEEFLNFMIFIRYLLASSSILSLQMMFREVEKQNTVEGNFLVYNLGISKTG